MIPPNAITAWGVDRTWATREQVEQDLLLSRSICAIAADPYLGEELVVRGGTALHKLHLQQPYRYSEDLDYVRRTASGIAPLTTASTTALGTDLGVPFVPRGQQGSRAVARGAKGGQAAAVRG